MVVQLVVTILSEFDTNTSCLNSVQKNFCLKIKIVLCGEYVELFRMRFFQSCHIYFKHLKVKKFMLNMDERCYEDLPNHNLSNQLFTKIIICRITFLTKFMICRMIFFTKFMICHMTFKKNQVVAYPE